MATATAEMANADMLRAEAERCFRLARGVNDPGTVARLEGRGRELGDLARQAADAAWFWAEAAGGDLGGPWGGLGDQ